MEKFPLYRRSASGRNLYRIDAADRFLEVQLIGSQALSHEVVARAYPEKVLLRDIIHCAHGAFVEISAEEFETALARTG